MYSAYFLMFHLIESLFVFKYILLLLNVFKEIKIYQKTVKKFTLL